MSWAPVTRMVDVAVTGGVPLNLTSAGIVSQRINDERGTMGANFQGGTAFPGTGVMVLQARLSPDATFGDVFEFLNPFSGP